MRKHRSDSLGGDRVQPCRKCTLCDNPATVRYRRIWICDECLNPEPSADYLRAEREQITGGWGVVSPEDWNYH